MLFVLDNTYLDNISWLACEYNFAHAIPTLHMPERILRLPKAIWLQRIRHRELMISHHLQERARHASNQLGLVVNSEVNIDSDEGHIFSKRLHR
jgi:hypothetical protein